MSEQAAVFRTGGRISPDKGEGVHGNPPVLPRVRGESDSRARRAECHSGAETPDDR